MGAGRRAVKSGLVALLVILGLIAVPTAASAATGDVGFVGAAYTGATNPTADKPQSKMWFADGRWWANMFDPVSADWHIYYLNRATEKWIDTKVAVDTRPATSSDALWDGQFLYIGTHGIRTGSNASSATTPMRLYRYTFNNTTKQFVASSGFPKVISQNSTESLTIDKDSGGTVWATWTKVTGTSGQVFVNSGTGNGTTWGTPFVVPTTGGLNATSVVPNVAVDDISTLTAFGQNRIGLLWSNQTDNTVYWSIHRDGDPAATWKGGVAASAPKIADDHLNIKSIQSDAQGRVFALVKTSLDTATGHVPGDPQINLLTYKPDAGAETWSSTTFGRIQDCHTRPQMVLDETNSKVYVFATGKTGTGTCTSTGSGAIYMKSAPLASPSFSTGSGTMVMRDVGSENLNNVTTTKQSASSASGVVVLASNDSTKKYWHADVVPGSGTTLPAPTANFTMSPSPATVGSAVAFIDTSTGSPTSWSWNFGDGSAVSTAQSPSYTFATANTYTVTLTATNAVGSSAPVSKQLTVNPAAAAGVTTVGSWSGGNTAANAAVTLTKPTGVVAGDVLIAQVHTDGVPELAAPAGWAPVVDPVSLNTNAKLFTFYRVAGAGEPVSYQWTMTPAIKWNGGMTAFRGVNNGNPFDGAGVTGINPATAATTLTLPGVTTTVPGAVVIGGIGLNGTATTVTPPLGWTEAFEQRNAQVTEFAGQARPAAGASGAAAWTFSAASISVGWMRALRPA
jgi:PKD repeat protein